MSEAIAIPALAVAGTDLALETHAVTGTGVTLVLEEPASRWSLRARSADALAAVIGRGVPARIGDTLDGVACLGPDEWLADLPAGTVTFLFTDIEVRRGCSKELGDAAYRDDLALSAASSSRPASRAVPRRRRSRCGPG